MSEGLEVALLGVGLLVWQGVMAPALALPEVAWPLPYALFWLSLPFRWGAEVTLLVSVAFGVLLDLISPPWGLHTFCGLWVWALRRRWLTLLHPFPTEAEEASFSLGELSSTEFFVYAFPLTVVYLLGYFPLAMWELSNRTLLLIAFSSLYSFLWEWSIFELILRRRHARR